MVQIFKMFCHQTVYWKTVKALTRAKNKIMKYSKIKTKHLIKWSIIYIN